MKILMFGWEFPPFNSGGLGVACKGLISGLLKQNAEVLLVLPKKLPYQTDLFKMIFADSSGIKAKVINSLISPYLDSLSYGRLFKLNTCDFYGSDLFVEVRRYAEKAAQIALDEDFDVIHAHDWLSFLAGLKAKEVSNKPLVVHVHATEFDRTGGLNVNPFVYQIEKQGLEKSQAIIAVSNYTKGIIVKHYGIEPQKIFVVYNAFSEGEMPSSSGLENLAELKKQGKRFVLFVGRLTLQKGPDYFLRAAQKVLELNSDVRFIIVGAGDMEHQVIEESAWLGISDKVFFVGFLERGAYLAKIYQLADLYVLPSVSEPFGITVLEALSQGTPALISKQAGVGEKLSHCLKVDFWDIDEIANKILAVLKHPVLRETLSEESHRELYKFSWDDSAKQCLRIYNEVINK